MKITICGWEPEVFLRDQQIREWAKADGTPQKFLEAWWLGNDRGFAIGPFSFHLLRNPMR